MEFGMVGLEKCVSLCKDKPVKYLILAGDITNYSNRERHLEIVVNKLKPYHDHIIYVLGNHEYYKNNKLPPDQVVNEYKFICAKLGIYLLENEYLETDDCVFYGATMWSKFSKGAYNRTSDSFSFTKKEDIDELHDNSKYMLETFVENYKGPKKLYVITHYLPSFSVIDDKYKQNMDLNTAFASDLDHIIKPCITAWIYGHTHLAKNNYINDVQVVCNPYGYPGENHYMYDDVTLL